MGSSKHISAPGAMAIAGNQVHVAVMTEEESRQVRELSMQVEAEASKLRKTAKACMRYIGDECTRANLRVEKHLTERTAQASEVTKKLIQQGKEADGAIMQAQRSLQMSKKFFDGNDKQSASNFLSAKNALQVLAQARQDLSEDLRQKTILLNTSEACRKVTALTACSHAAYGGSASLGLCKAPEVTVERGATWA